MSKHLESVEITFENLDYVLVPVESFEDFCITGIRTTVERQALVLKKDTTGCRQMRRSPGQRCSERKSRKNTCNK